MTSPETKKRKVEQIAAVSGDIASEKLISKNKDLFKKWKIVTQRRKEASRDDVIAQFEESLISKKLDDHQYFNNKLRRCIEAHQSGKIQKLDSAIDSLAKVNDYYRSEAPDASVFDRIEGLDADLVSRMQKLSVLPFAEDDSSNDGSVDEDEHNNSGDAAGSAVQHNVPETGSTGQNTAAPDRAQSSATPMPSGSHSAQLSAKLEEVMHTVNNVRDEMHAKINELKFNIGINAKGIMRNDREVNDLQVEIQKLNP